VLYKICQETLKIVITIRLTDANAKATTDTVDPGAMTLCKVPIIRQETGKPKKTANTSDKKNYVGYSRPRFITNT